MAAFGVWVLPSKADLLNYSSYAYTDATYGTWAGTTPYTSENALVGNVEWLVFGPGEFAQAFPGSSYSPPAHELVYAYQVIPTGSSDTSTLQAAYVAGQPVDSIGSFPLTDPSDNPGLTPTLATSASLGSGYDSAYYFFAGGIVTGNASAGLAYASPDTPEMQFGSLVNSGLGAIANPLPAPSDTPYTVPEPSAVILLLLQLSCWGSAALVEAGTTVELRGLGC